MKIDLDALEVTLESDMLLALVAEVRAARAWLDVETHAIHGYGQRITEAREAYRAIVKENSRD